MKKRILNSGAMAAGALILIIVILVCTFQLRSYWWAFCDIFFAFMMVFLHGAAILFRKMNPASSRRLDFLALICGILTVVSLIVEWALYQFMVN